jgi:hypothetical protein
MRYLVYFALVFLYSCSGSSESSSGLLPPASGKPGEMIVVADSSQWAGALGETIRETFGREVPGINRPEPMFKMNRVEPAKMTRILRTVKNLMFVVTLDSNTPASRRIRSYFSESALERIRMESDIYVLVDNDEFAKGQQVMYLFGQTEEQLINHIRENSDNLIALFNQAEAKRLRSTLYKGQRSEGIKKTLIDQHNCSMEIPFGWRLEYSTRGFVWIRQVNDDNDKNIFISYVPYTSENLFTKDGLIAYRDSVAQVQLFEDPDRTDSFVVTETSVPFIPVETRQVDFNGKYAINMSGLWRTNNFSMGGPFTAYAMVDQSMNRFYYIEGFIFSPDKSQRELVREMRVILNTFRTAEMRNGSSAGAAN